MYHLQWKFISLGDGNGGAENDELAVNFGSGSSGVANSSISFENDGNYEQISNQ